jgi:excisionase family DNA binding protein
MSDQATLAVLLTESLKQAIETKALPREAYSVEETAQILGVTRRTITGLIDSQQLRVVRVGRHHRIDRKEIERFLGRHK